MKIPSTIPTRTANKRRRDANKALDAVGAELKTLSVTNVFEPENAPRAGTIMARTLLLDFVADRLSRRLKEFQRRPDISAVTKLAALFFVENPTHPSIGTYHWGARIFSELHNCCQLLDAVSYSNTLRWVIKLDEIHDLEYTRSGTYNNACMIKAYNVLMDVMAKRINTPELLFTKADDELMELISLCEDYNEHTAGAHINIDHLLEPAPAAEKKRIIHGLDNSSATLQSLMFSVYVSLRFNSETGRQYDDYY